MISPERIERLDELYSNDFKGFADAMIREWEGIRDALRARSELSEGTIEAAALRARAEMPDEISDRAKAIRSRGGAFHHETADMLDSLSRRAAELEAQVEGWKHFCKTAQAEATEQFKRAAKLEAENEILKTENRRLKAEVKDARDEGRDIAAERSWKDRQRDEYGSY